MKNTPQQSLAVKYATALLKAFELRGGTAVAIRFNAGDLYEILTGKSSGDGLVSLNDVIKASQDPESVDPKDYKEHAEAANRLLKGYEQSKLSIKEMLMFMEMVENALTLTELVAAHGGRDLIINQYDGDKWIAFDVSKVETVEIDF